MAVHSLILVHVRRRKRTLRVVLRDRIQALHYVWEVAALAAALAVHGHEELALEGYTVASPAPQLLLNRFRVGVIHLLQGLDKLLPAELGALDAAVLNVEADAVETEVVQARPALVSEALDKLLRPPVEAVKVCL